MKTQIQKKQKEGAPKMPIKNRPVKKTATDWKEIERIHQRRAETQERQRLIRYQEAKDFLGEPIDETNLQRLERSFREIAPMDFYQDIFRDYLDEPGEFNKGEYVALMTEQTKRKKPKADGSMAPVNRNYRITNGLFELDSIISTSKNFCFMSPISYCGRHKSQANARMLFALTIEIDNLIERDGIPYGLTDLIYEIENGVLPRPTYIVHSGSGVHLYFVFERPYALYKRTAQQLKILRRKLVKKFWNQYITTTFHEKEIQWENLYQSFRVVGTRTKFGLRTNSDDVARAFIYGNGDKVDFEYLASFTDYSPKDEAWKKSIHTKEEVKELYPDWYNRHFDKNGKKIKHPERKFWSCKPELYQWYLAQIPEKAQQGHRYYSLMCLASYALKSGISKKQFTNDCKALLDTLENLTTDDDNHFTKEDIDSAIACYNNKNLTTLSINSINNFTGFDIKKNKRNGRTRAKSLEYGRAIQQAKDLADGTNWRDGNGRKSKKYQVYAWRQNNPNGTKYRCQKDLGLSKNTVKKWWDFNLQGENNL